MSSKPILTLVYAACADLNLEPKEVRASAIHWFERGGKVPNDKETLFFALLACWHADGKAEQQEWSSLVLERHEAAWKVAQEDGAGWQVPADWKRPGHACTRLITDSYSAEWSADMLHHIGAAMQLWRHAGQMDNLTPGRLKEHRTWARDAKVRKQGLATARLHAAIVPAARLLKSHGPTLRRLLKLDETCESVPSAVEELQAAQAAQAALAAELAVQVKAKIKIVDAHRKLKEARKKSRKAVSTARVEERKKAAEAKKAALQIERQKMLERIMAARERIYDRAMSDMEELKAKLERGLSKARARARAVEGSAKLSAKRLRRAKNAESVVSDLRKQLDDVMEEMETEDEGSGSSDTGRRDARGRFEAGDWRLRPIEWGQLSRRVPPAAVGANVRDVLRVHAPDVEYAEPTERQIRMRRMELTVAGECIANFRVAKSLRIISFGSDESTKFGLGLLSTNTQIEPHDAPGTSVDVVQRGAALTAGASAEAVAASIDKNIFARGRRQLIEWKSRHESMFGTGSWAAAGGPDPESIGMHRLSENTVIMGDTCNTAEKTKRLVIEVAEAAGKERIGEAAWATMSEEQRASKCKAHVGRCHQHLRNIVINAMQLKQAEALKHELGDSLDEFNSFDRMSADVNDLIRAISKELHAGQSYAKGKGREATAWRKAELPAHPHLPYERAEGSRQDIALDGSVPIFWNRVPALTFLQGLMVPGASNILEKFLLRTLSCNEMTAALRVNTLMKYVYSEPARWLAGKAGELGWGLDDATELIDLTEKLMIDIATDGRKLLDESYDPWAPLAAKHSSFAAWRKERMEKTIKSPDGKAHPIHALILGEARAPSGAGNAQATPRVVALAQEMANAALVAMRDPRRAICDLLTSQDGKFCVGKDPKRNQATAGAHVTNDRVESNFGCVDTLMQMFRYATVESISGMAQQMRQHDFDTAPAIVSDRRKRKHEKAAHVGGFFYTGLTPELQESLVAYARCSAGAAREAGHEALRAHEAEKLERREERVITLLNRHIEQYAYAMELYEAWAEPGGQRARSAKEVQAALLDVNGRQKPEVQQLEYLRYQIEMRVLGLGWTQYATRWSSSKDSRVGTVAHLQQLLEEILSEERGRERFERGTAKGLPSEAAPPQGEWRDTKQLGTLDADAQAVRSRVRFSADELKQKAKGEMQRREEAGISDAVERKQPEHAPAFNQELVGKRIEVLWKYYEKESEKATLIWSTGRVVRVADGLTDKRSKRAQKILPGGAVLWAWDADPEFDRQQVSNGLYCCPASGIQRSIRMCTAGGMIRVSSVQHRSRSETQGASRCAALSMMLEHAFASTKSLCI